MALQTSGAISLNDIHVEADGTSGSATSINDADNRGLISKSSGASMAFNEWYGASGTFTMTLTTGLSPFNGTFQNRFTGFTLGEHNSYSTPFVSSGAAGSISETHFPSGARVVLFGAARYQFIKSDRIYFSIIVEGNWTGSTKAFNTVSMSSALTSPFNVTFGHSMGSPFQQPAACYFHQPTPGYSSGVTIHRYIDSTGGRAASYYMGSAGTTRTVTVT